MSAARSALQAAQSGCVLAPLIETDLPEIAAFISAQSGRPCSEVASHLRWFLLENPARDPQQPLAFGLRSSGELVGCILCHPQWFQYQKQKVLLMGSSSFYVDERHRGSGGRIFLQYSRLAARWPLFGTSANVMASALWKSAGAAPISNSDGELFGVLRWPPIAEEFAHRRKSNPLTIRLAASPLSHLASLFRSLKLDDRDPSLLQPLTSPEEVSDVISISSPQKLTALRDPAYIRWRYFSGRDSTVALFSYQSAVSRRNILVTVNQRPRGYRGQIRTLNLLDIFPQVESHDSLRIVAALTARYSRNVDALVLRNLDQETQQLFRGRGFRWRAFDAPIGWLLDRANLLPARQSYFVPADGDGLI